MSYLYCIVITFAIQSVTLAAEPCCFPQKYEILVRLQAITFGYAPGETHFSEEKFNISVDYVGKKEAISVLYYSVDGIRYPPYFVLIDYLNSVTWAAAPCCFPPKFEGSFSFQSINFIGTTGEIDASEMKFNRSVDNVGKKEAISVLYQNLNGKSYPPYFILNDYQNGMEYIVQDNKCEKRPITLPMPSNCLPDGATQVIQDNLGAENEMLSLNRYVYKKPSSNLTDNVFVTEQNCYPVLYTLTMVDGRTVQQMLISGMSVGIKNPDIFNVPDVCKQTEPHGKILSQDFRMRLFFWFK